MTHQPRLEFGCFGTVSGHWCLPCKLNRRLISGCKSQGFGRNPYITHTSNVFSESPTVFNEVVFRQMRNVQPHRIFRPRAPELHNESEVGPAGVVLHLDRPEVVRSASLVNTMRSMMSEAVHRGSQGAYHRSCNSLRKGWRTWTPPRQKKNLNLFRISLDNNATPLSRLSV